jgi:hypothetical protein
VSDEQEHKKKGRSFYFYILKVFLKKYKKNLFFLFQINIIFSVFRYFNVLMSKIIFKK